MERSGASRRRPSGGRFAMKYLILAYTGAQQWDEQSVTADEIARICREYDSLEQRLKSSGEWLASEGLADHSQTITVAKRDGDVIATDGPYLEVKESMVSYVLIDVADHERALEIARELVALSGETCELRPVMDMEIPDLA